MPATQRHAPAVVVPAIGAPSSVTVLRSLGPRGVHTIAASERDSPPAFSSRHCDERVSVPDPTADMDAYADALLDLAARGDVRTIVPVREHDVYVLSTRREEFAAHVATPWPTADQLEVAQDRDRLFEVAAEAGVPAPETELLGDVEDWDRKLIVKSRYAIVTGDQVESLSTPGTASISKTLFLDPGERPDIGALREQMHHDPIVQEYVDGPEYTVRVLADHGEPVVTSIKRLVRGYKYSRGPSVCHEAVSNPTLEAQATTLLDALDWHGVASVGFKQDTDTGEYKLMEINPRFWANLPLDGHAGVDYPYYYWQLAADDIDGVECEYAPGTASHLLRGELVHLHSVCFEDYGFVEKPSLASTVRDIAVSLSRQPNFDYLSLSDPGPFVRDTWNTVRSLV